MIEPGGSTADHGCPTIWSIALICLALVLLILISTSAIADDGVFLGTGGSVTPSQSSSVRMVAEEVDLDISDQFVRGKCTFVFFNDGPAETLLVGFPDHSPGGDDISENKRGRPSIYDLKITIDGQEVATEVLPVAKPTDTTQSAWPSRRIRYYDWVHTWTCDFQAGQTRILRTEYEHAMSTSVGDPCILDYMLTTGASWAGSIGKIVVRIRPGRLRLKTAYHPREWLWTGSEYVWTAENLEPTENINLSFEDPAKYVRCVIHNWNYMTGRTSEPSQIFEVKYASEGCGHLGRPEFFRLVCEELGDSLPDLRIHLEELYDSDNRWKAP